MIIEVSILASIFIIVVQIIAESALKHRGNNIEVCFVFIPLKDQVSIRNESGIW